jgi:lipopolysaccharide heptosyltransferase II
VRREGIRLENVLLLARRRSHDRATLLKVLILKPSSLGDVVQALPVLRLIKLQHPDSEIFWWIESSLAPLLENDPDLTEVVRFDRKGWRMPWRWGDSWQRLRRLRAQRFDWVIDLQSLFRSGVVAWLVDGALTIGLDDPREGARGFYDVAVPRSSYDTHAVDWYLSVLPLLGVAVHRNFTWLPAQPRVASALRDKWHPDPGRWIALQPGARWSNKRWPLEYFIEATRRLTSMSADLRFAILGGTADRELGDAIASAAPGRCLNLTGCTSLLEMIEWTRFCELMITNDTGPMHVAAALGKPVVATFGPTDPRRTGPYGQLNHVLQLKLPCVPCMKDSCDWERPLECLRALGPEAVVARVLELLPCSSTPALLNRDLAGRVD